MIKKTVKQLQEDFTFNIYGLNPYVDIYKLSSCNYTQYQQEIVNILNALNNKIQVLDGIVRNLNDRLVYHENRQEELIKEMAGIIDDKQ